MSGGTYPRARHGRKAARGRCAWWCGMLVALIVSACAGPTEEARDIAEGWIAAVSALDHQSMMSLWAEEGVVFFDPSFERPLLTKPDVAAAYEGLFALPEVAIEPTEPVVSDDGSTVTIEWVWTGRAPGRIERYRIPGVSVLTIEARQIVAETTYYNSSDTPFELPGG